MKINKIIADDGRGEFKHSIKLLKRFISIWKKKNIKFKFLNISTMNDVDRIYKIEILFQFLNSEENVIFLLSGIPNSEKEKRMLEVILNEK